jgi:hypothetical protein
MPVLPRRRHEIGQTYPSRRARVRPSPELFHADPRGQLCMKHQARAMGATPPSYFPRLHMWCAEGYMPTPRLLAQPRCRHCGMPLDDTGF